EHRTRAGEMLFYVEGRSGRLCPRHRFRRKFGQAKVENLGVAPLSDKYVGRLNVPMNDSLAVSRSECVRNLNPPFKHLLKRKGLAGDVVLQRLPVEKLHRNEGLTIVFADFIDGANIGM